MNASGEVVGRTIVGYHEVYGFAWTKAHGMSPVPGSVGASAVNDAGRIVGQGFGSWAFGFHPMTWTEADGAVDIGTFGGPVGDASDVDANGRVVGGAVTATGDEHAFVWTQATGIRDLGTLGGKTSYASAIDDDGWIVGWAATTDDSSHAALWTETWVPDAPREVVAEGGDGQATVEFAAPDSDGGSAVLYYTATASPGGRSAGGTGSPITVYGLANGTDYTFTVTATNSIGTGAPSAPSPGVTPAGADRPGGDPPTDAQPRPAIPSLDAPTGRRPPPPGHS
jgi:probable HAF family extracellular repeat protein